MVEVGLFHPAGPPVGFQQDATDLKCAKIHEAWAKPLSNHSMPPLFGHAPRDVGTDQAQGNGGDILDRANHDTALEVRDQAQR